MKTRVRNRVSFKCAQYVFLVSLFALGTAPAQDPTEGTFTRTADMTSPRERHTATLLVNGKVLIAGGNTNIEPATNPTNTAELFDLTASPVSVTPLPPMISARSGHTATRLADGTVLIAGGDTGSEPADAGKIFDPASSIFTPSMPNVVQSPHYYHRPTGQSEQFDPTSEVFTAVEGMSVPRVGHTATLLPNGKVLITGGVIDDSGTVTNTAELFDPLTRTFTPLPNTLNSARELHTATLLENGKVLIAGGNTENGPTNTAELFDPASGIFTPLPTMIVQRSEHTATLLPDGNVLIAGGLIGADVVMNTAERFDPASGTFTLLSPMTEKRSAHAATLLPDGKVLIAGGNTGSGPTKTGETFDPVLGIFTPLLPQAPALENTMTEPRYYHRPTMVVQSLGRKKVLITGGITTLNGVTRVTNTAELFNPPQKAPVVVTQRFSFSTVALTGQHAPGTAPGVNYLNVHGDHALNAAGQCVFRGGVTGPAVTSANDGGIWLGQPGAVALLGREGDPAPGTAGATYSGFVVSPMLNAAGQGAFRAIVSGILVTAANNTGIWSGAPGNVALLARAGDLAPGTAIGVSYARFEPPPGPTLNAAGQSQFLAALAGPGVTSANDRALWSGAPGSVTLLAREGDSAPGMTAGVNYSFVSALLTLNATGQSGFRASVIGPGVTAVDDDGIWFGAPGGVALLAREGDPAPGMAAGVNYSGFDVPTINAAGQSAFRAGVSGPGVTFANDSGIWSDALGSVALLMRAGDPAPGTGAGINYSGFFGAPTINAAGQSAFEAEVTGAGVTSANDSGLWRGAPDSLAKVVYEGEAAPGAGTGILFGETGGHALNDRGEVVFVNFLTGPGVTPANDQTLWFADAAGILSLIVREGDPFEVAPGDTRILSGFSFEEGSGDEDGLPCGFNDLGQVAFYATFTDDSEGIFIATPAPQLTAAVSRKMHDGVGPCDIVLPLTGEPGVECRSSAGVHSLVFSFNNSVVSGNASVSSGTGSVSGTPTSSGNTMTVNLTGVADMQKITVTLSGVTDNFSHVLPDTAVNMGVLLGDTTGNGTVNSSDIGQTKSQSGQAATGSNFRTDVTVNGVVNSSDIALVKSKSGTALP